MLPGKSDDPDINVKLKEGLKYQPFSIIQASLWRGFTASWWCESALQVTSQISGAVSARWCSCCWLLWLFFLFFFWLFCSHDFPDFSFWRMNLFLVRPFVLLFFLFWSYGGNVIPLSASRRRFKPSTSSSRASPSSSWSPPCGWSTRRAWPCCGRPAWRWATRMTSGQAGQVLPQKQKCSQAKVQHEDQANVWV